jgi:alkaline phosphatase D
MSDWVRRLLASRNPHVKFYNSQRGFVSCELTATGMRADYHVLDKVTTDDGQLSTRASFHVAAGKPGAERA